jgi:hypothetical protein
MSNISIQAIQGDRVSFSFSKDITQQEVEDLKDRLIRNDEKIERISRYSFALPRLSEAQKTESYFLNQIRAGFTDLITLPFERSDRTRAYRTYLQEELKPQLPIYQFLKASGVPKTGLDNDEFKIILCSEEKKECNFKSYDLYDFHVYHGPAPHGSGYFLINKPLEAFKQGFVMLCAAMSFYLSVRKVLHSF